MNEKPLIIGIDPGNTSAVAALDLNGETEFLISRKEFSHHEIIRIIVENGYPLVIAADREEIPSTVNKIASSLGAKKFTPENDLSRRRKDKLGKALHAYKSLSKQIRKINSRAETDREKLDVARKHLLKT
ncbi:MAG: hypothetical protein BRC28_02755 [Nanohaloarchaea archaeon SW_4_43_9]|nr:MAG: hypothetical protein BRC28_02755 [Nanohaloarchaea archaeon SW_4_43_9]